MEADRRAEVWAKTGGRCWYCGTQTSPWKDFHVEHSIPKSKGGTDALENLVPSCSTCNARKHDRDIEEFRVYLQTKAQHTFWYEHAKLPMVVMQPEMEEEDEEEYPKEWPDGDDWNDFIRYCFYGRDRGPEFVLTTIALLHNAFVWEFNDNNELPSCTGVFTLDWLAWDTGQSLQLLLSHLFWLQSIHVLTIKYNSERGHDYQFFIGSYMQAWQKIETTERALAKREVS